MFLHLKGFLLLCDVKFNLFSPVEEGLTSFFTLCLNKVPRYCNKVVFIDRSGWFLDIVLVIYAFSSIILDLIIHQQLFGIHLLGAKDLLPVCQTLGSILYSAKEMVFGDRLLNTKHLKIQFKIGSFMCGSVGKTPFGSRCVVQLYSMWDHRETAWMQNLKTLLKTNRLKSSFYPAAERC
ncbi:hypothetical protein ILYODFUR_025877 [Ilyodon furcidens]|uniref:Uncharacterized protein n=1 Tax=Ilyodon furcidens TaxID=33524 RepID=A0ABV0SPB5_9TELE